MATDLLLPANLTVINATPFVWEKTLNESSHMVQWDNAFPDYINPGEILPIPMEFTNSNSTAAGEGSVIYSFLNGSTYDFSFAASAKRTSTVSVKLLNTKSMDDESDEIFDLAWDSNSTAGMPFVLASSTGAPPIPNTNMPVDWMQQNLATLGCQSLRRICIPGSHDAGMSVLTHATLLSNPDNTLAQWIDVAGQLDAGFRYFDIRPVISAGQFVMGHYSEIVDSWVGGNGQDLASIIDQVNNFLSTNNELVILDVSHVYNSDDNWRSLNPAEISRLLNQLSSLQHLYTGPTGPNGDLSSMPLNNFIGQNNPAVIVVISEPSIGLPTPAPAGIFPFSSLNIYNSYANTPFPTVMRSDQLSKLSKQRKSNDDAMFLLSWTLTTVLNIRQLATQAHSLLFETSSSGLWQTIYKNKASYPNILYIDGIGAPNPSPIAGRNVAALSMAINHVVLDGVACVA